MNKINSLLVEHRPAKSAWCYNSHRDYGWHCVENAHMVVHATMENGDYALVASIYGLDTSRIEFKKRRALRYFAVLLGQDEGEARETIFTFGQSLWWKEVKEGELY